MAIIPRLTKPYNLLCKVPPQDGTGVVEEFTNRAQRYRHAIRWQGGFWEATWFFPLGGDNTAAYLRDWFETRLAYRHEERVGGVVSWEGIVWEMNLTLDGYREHKSLANVFNAVKTIYLDTTDTSQETVWYTDETSINRYGRREFVLLLDNVTTTQAQAAAQKALAEAKEAWPRVTGIGKQLSSGLDVTAVGDVFTANNRYVTASEGTNYTDYVTNLVATDCDRLTAGNIKTNALESSPFGINIRAWDAILELVERGDDNYNAWRFWVTAGGLAHYEQADNTPIYEWHGSKGGLVDPMGGKSNWLVKPGVVRNMTRREGIPIPGSPLADSRDAWVKEVEMAQGAPEPLLSPAGISAESIENKKKQYAEWLAEKAA